MIKDLSWDNYIELNDISRTDEFVFDYFSFIQLVQWNYYDLKIKFHQLQDVIILYIKLENEDWKLFNSFYKKNFDIKRAKIIIKEDLFVLNKHSKIDIFDFSIEAIQDWKLEENNNVVESNYISNYIYPLEQLKTFIGKKMTKKRNHLNYFINSNYKIKIVDLINEDIEKVINFTIELNKKYSNEIREQEIKIYKEFLTNQIKKDNRFKGTSYYVDNELVGYTLGFVNGDIYEIIIEKAEKDIRGIYQYILKTNLNYHDINCLYIDREDDLGDPMIAKSKKSYHPIKEVKRYCVDDAKL